MPDVKERSPRGSPQEGAPTVGVSKAGGALKPFEEIYRKYLQELQEAWAPGDVQKHLWEAFLDYVRALREAGPSDALKCFEAYLSYVRALQEAWVPEDARKRFKGAYRNYVRGLQEGWAHVDVNALGASSLATISQSTMVVAFYAGRTLSRTS